MSILKALFEFYINSSIHVALAVTALTQITGLHFGLHINIELLGFVFFGAITGYNFVKYAGIAQLHHRSLAKDLKAIQIFSFLCFLSLLYFSFQVDSTVLLVAGILGVFTLLYALPVFSKKRNLRDIKGVKIYIIALVWAGVSVLFPVIDSLLWLTPDIIIEFFQRFLFVLVIILPFEIRDLKYDPGALGTMPQKLGVKKTKMVGMLFLGIWVFAENFKTSVSAASFMSMVLTAVVTGILVLSANEKKSTYFSSFWVEGIPILWLLLLIFLLQVL